MSSLFRRFISGPSPSAPPASAPVAGSPDDPLVTTEADVRMCFRLLLGREPNAEEWAGHSAHAGQELGRVVAGYLNSLEFARRGLLRPDADARPELAEWPGFGIYALPSDLQIGQHVLAGVYEPEVAAVFNQVLRPGMTVIDIGANIGFFTMLSASLVGLSGAVLAIEPNPANGRLIEASRRHNGFEHVVVAQVAAGRAVGMLVLHTTHSNGTTSEADADLDSLMQARTVPCVPVAALAGSAWPAGRRVDFIKVDVEGAEYNALLGAEAVIVRDRPVIVSEFAPSFMPGISGIDGPGYLTWLHDHGYQVDVIQPEGPPVPAGQDVGVVMAAFERRGIDHIDLLLTPA